MLTEEELTAAFPFYEKASKKTREFLQKNAEKNYFSKGERLPYENGVRYFYIRRGSVNVFREGENGGEFFLYRAAKDNSCVTSDLLKYEFAAASEVIVFNEECFVQACSGAGGAYFLSVSRRQEDNAVLQFDSIMFDSVESRLASVLLAASARARSHTLNFTHEQLASFIGSSREVVTRKLSALSEEGVLDAGRGKIILKNKEALKKKK